MSKYTCYYISRQNMYRDFATRWSTLTDANNLTDTQRKGMALFFSPIARRFGLVKEFKDIGVI